MKEVWSEEIIARRREETTMVDITQRREMTEDMTRRKETTGGMTPTDTRETTHAEETILSKTHTRTGSTHTTKFSTVSRSTARRITIHLRIVFNTSLSRDMAAFPSTSSLYVTSITGLSLVYPRIAFCSKRLSLEP